jgi:hypothetical protein
MPRLIAKKKKKKKKRKVFAGGNAQVSHTNTLRHALRRRDENRNGGKLVVQGVMRGR